MNANDPLKDYGENKSLLPHKPRIHEASKTANQFTDIVICKHHYMIEHEKCVKFEDLKLFLRFC